MLSVFKDFAIVNEMTLNKIADLLFAQLLETTVPDSLISESRITLKSCAICILKFWLDKDMKVKKSHL